MPVKNMVGKDDVLPAPERHIGGGNGIQDIFQTVQELKRRLQDEGDTIEPLNNILQDKRMQALIRVHEKVKPIDERQHAGPVSSNSLTLVNNLQSADYKSGTGYQELQELNSHLQSSPHLMALLECHDQIASKDFEPELPEAEANDSMGDEEESMKVVRLVKGNEPLGATIAVDELTNNIVIARILKGGAADRSGLIHVNDILVEVNKVPARGKKPEELISLLADFRGPLTFRLIPGETPLSPLEDNEPEMYVRAKFDYFPERDRLIPCAEAGLSFRKNDVLRIVSRDDESWWQAALVEEGVHARRLSARTEQCGSYYRVRHNAHLSTTGATRAGLIPSNKLQTRRETLRRQATVRNHNNNAVKGSSSSLTSRDQRDKKSAWSLLRQSFRRSNRRLDQSTPSPDHSRCEEVPVDPATVIAYEEVVLLSPASEASKESCVHRPIVLVGPQGVGRNELKDRLIDSNPTHYGVPVPHTSRPQLDEEEDGKDYHFVTREFMERGIRDNMFLEYGEYKGNLYGTSLDSVKAVITHQQVCVLTPYPQALKILRNSELKPFVIFIKPPTLKKVDEGGSAVTKAKLTIDRDMTVPFSTEELRDLVGRGEKMESAFGHWFDYVVVNDGVDRAFNEVKQVAFAIENEAQWVLKEWTNTN